MLYPARFVAVKPPQEGYEQRLKDAERYSEEAISSVLEQAGMDVEGSDAVVVNAEVQAAATALENFIYEKEVEDEKTEEKVEEEKVEESTEENTGGNEAATEEKDNTAEAKATNGETAQETAQDGVDQEMKEGPADA